MIIRFHSSAIQMISHHGRRWAQPSNYRPVQRCWASTAAAMNPAKTVIQPTVRQLRIVALRASIPMVGFGFMDNLVMITAGEAIDSTFGVTLGISTMAAAGFGQCCSDVAGITSGGLVDAAVSRLRLPTHGLNQAQLDLRITRIYSAVGASAGVLVGCLLGMSILFFMDTDRVDRARKAKELQSIFESVMTKGAKLFGAERATLFMLDEEKEEVWSQVATGEEGIIKVPSHVGIVGACIDSGDIINIPDAYRDSRFNRSVDASTGFHTKSVLAIPVKNDNGKTIGAIQMCNKKKSDGTDTSFGPNDETLIRMLASHVTSFISIVEGDD